MRSRFVFALTLSSFAALAGCNTYAAGLDRSRDAYEHNQHERSLAILRSLEPDENHLTDAEQTQYAYLRGMTDYRIGYLQDARHWLLVAKELDKANPKALNEDWKGRMNSVIEELNTKVFNEGLDSLSATAPKPHGADDEGGKKGGDSADKPKAKGDKSEKSDDAPKKKGAEE